MSRTDDTTAQGNPPAPPGCPVCAAQSKAVFDALVAWHARLAHDDEAEREFVARRGFCAFHMWLLQQIGDPLTLTRALAPLVAAWADDLVAAERPGASVELAATVPSRDACPVCTVERASGAAALARLAALAAATGHAELAAVPLLCLRHLTALLVGVPPDAASRLRRAGAARLRELEELLRSYLAHRTAPRREATSEAEQEAWRSALAWLAGARALRDADPPPAAAPGDTDVSGRRPDGG